MEAIFSPSSPDQPISTYKQKINPRKTQYNSLVIQPSENFASAKDLFLNIHGSISRLPPSLSSSLSIHPQKQPPLLPLPIPKPYSSFPYPKHCKINKNKVHDLKKPKASMNPKKQDTKENPSERMIISNLVYVVSPPPSSLPLPKFSLKPKRRCNVEAAGIDAGATDNLRRLLRLR